MHERAVLKHTSLLCRALAGDLSLHANITVQKAITQSDTQKEDGTGRAV